MKRATLLNIAAIVMFASWVIDLPQAAARVIPSSPGCADVSLFQGFDRLQNRAVANGGRAYVITPTIQNDGRLLLNIKIAQNEKILSSPKIYVSSGRAAAVTLGGRGLELTAYVREHAKVFIIMKIEHNGKAVSSPRFWTSSGQTVKVSVGD